MILGLYTATRPYSVAIISPDTHCIQAVRLQTDSVETLPIKAVCSDAGIDLQAISAIGVTTGPGGYTATRIGVTIANTLSQALQKPVYGLSTLDTIAQAARLYYPSNPRYTTGQTLMAMIPTVKHWVATQLFSIQASQVIALSHRVIIKETDFKQRSQTTPVITVNQYTAYATVVAHWVATIAISATKNTPNNAPISAYAPVIYAHNPVSQSGKL